MRKTNPNLNIDSPKSINNDADSFVNGLQSRQSPNGPHYSLVLQRQKLRFRSVGRDIFSERLAFLVRQTAIWPVRVLEFVLEEGRFYSSLVKVPVSAEKRCFPS